MIYSNNENEMSILLFTSGTTSEAIRIAKNI